MSNEDLSLFHNDPRLQPGAVLRPYNRTGYFGVLMQVDGQGGHRQLLCRRPGADRPFLLSPLEVVAKTMGVENYELVMGHEADEFRAALAAEDLRRTLEALPAGGQAIAGFAIGMAMEIGNAMEVVGPYYTGATDRGSFWSLNIDDAKIYQHRYQADSDACLLMETSQSPETILGVREVWRFSPADFPVIGKGADKEPWVIARAYEEDLHYWAGAQRHCPQSDVLHTWIQDRDKAISFDSEELAEAFVKRTFETLSGVKLVVVRQKPRAVDYATWMAFGRKLHHDHQGAEIGKTLWRARYGEDPKIDVCWNSFPQR